MTGFIRGLFSKKKKPEAPSNAFFLDDDSAKSLGNLDYMRTPNTVRRTFAKSLGSPEHKEYIQNVTAMSREVLPQSATQFQPKQRQKAERQLINEKSYPTFGGGSVKTSGSVKAEALQAEASKAQQPKVRSTGSSSMDVFRKMAKDLNKHS